MTSLARALVSATLATTAIANSLPYNPTKIFLPSNSSFAYIFDSTSQDDGSTRLLSLDISKQITSDGAAFNTLDSLPFGNGQARSVVQHTNGSLVAISGNCTEGASTTQVWTFTSGQDSAGNGSWTQSTVAGLQAVDYLADGMSFAGQSDTANSSIYLFGGMCPAVTASNTSWTSEASYSAKMQKMVRSDGVTQYIESTTISSGGPVAEAGFSITALPTSSQGNALGQQFVLIGGHTQTAFINMTQVAVFSLPQESWTFLPIQQPSSDPTAEVEPRSGHTAVLTQDGNQIVVFGGWVGDVGSPAEPQLAVLDIGAGYGGGGQWQWTSPSTNGTGLSANAGIFGHGAVMLPGNVMMVYGGYSIASSSSKARRAPSAQTLLYNVSSNQWITSYNAPASSASQTASSSASSGMSGAKIGLAVGLTIGALILLALIIFYFWYTRRTKRKQAEAERSLISRSSDGSFRQVSQPFLEKQSIDGRGGDMTALSHPWLSAAGANNHEMTEHGAATGLFTDNPSPTRGLRKGTPARNYQYQPAPRYDEKRMNRNSGNIHPIAEDDEDGDVRKAAGGMTLLSEAQRQLNEVAAILNSTSTPEKTRGLPDPLRSHPVSPEVGESSRHVSAPVRSGSPNWTIDPASDESISGRVSPTKTDDRTSSTLSDRSHRSVFSDNSITRTMSTRTGALLAAAAAAAHVRAKAVEMEAGNTRSSTMSSSGRASPTRTVVRSSTTGSSAPSESKSTGAGAYAESFRTARSHVTTRQQEAGGLLGARDYDDPYRRALVATDTMQGAGPLQYAPNRRRQGILGSLRKAIGAMSAGDRTISSTSRYGQLHSTNTSPTKERSNPIGGPRRTVSDGGALLRQKRGRHDWQDSIWPPYRDDPDPGDWGETLRTSIEKQQAEEEWDVENAAGKRDVQIMFTVPKSRLRVVNADMDRASLRSVSDGALSRAGSLRLLRLEESRTALSVREKLGPMMEVDDADKDKVL